MDVRLTDEQQMLQAMVGEVAARLGASRTGAPGADARLAASRGAAQRAASRLLGMQAREGYRRAVAAEGG